MNLYPVITQEVDGVDEPLPSNNSGVDGAMTQCDLCYDWFHNKCVSIAKHKDVKNSEIMKDVKVRLWLFKEYFTKQ